MEELREGVDPVLLLRSAKEDDLPGGMKDIAWAKGS